MLCELAVVGRVVYQTHHSMPEVCFHERHGGGTDETVAWLRLSFDDERLVSSTGIDLKSKGRRVLVIGVAVVDGLNL